MSKFIPIGYSYIHLLLQSNQLKRTPILSFDELFSSKLNPLVVANIRYISSSVIVSEFINE